jgi:hypothetical protein
MMSTANTIDWTAKDAQLRALKAQKVPYTQMAEMLEVSRGAIYGRLRKLGLVPVPPSLRSPRQRAPKVLPRPVAPPVPVDGIVCPKRLVLRQCAEAFRIAEPVLTGPSRKRLVIVPRHATFYILKKRFPEMSFPRIGELMGGRDHSTIIYGIRETENRMRRNPELAAKIAALITPPHDAHVAAWRLALMEADAVQALDAAQAEAARRAALASSGRDREAADARALAVIEGPIKVFCSQCDRRATLAEARACRSQFCGLKVREQVAA